MGEVSSEGDKSFCLGIQLSEEGCGALKRGLLDGFIGSEEIKL